MVAALQKLNIGATMTTSASNVIIQPRYQDKKETIEQYVQYFEDLVEANKWNDKQAASFFKTLLLVGSETRSLITGLSDVDRKSFVAIKGAIKESRKALRDAKVAELYSLQRKEGQSLE